jgi:ATP-binding cassette subfamily B protein
MSENQNTKQGMRGPGPNHGPMGMAIPGEKPKNFKQTFKRLASMLKPQLPVLIIMFIFSIGSTIFSVIAPTLLGNTINEISQYAFINIWDFDSIFSNIIKLILLYLGSSACMFVAQYVAARMSQTVVYNLRKDINAKLNKLPISYFDKTSKGDILSRITNDIETIATTLQQSITQIISSVAMLIGILYMMFKNNVGLSFVTLASLPIIIAVTMIIAKKAQKQFKAQQKHLGSLNGQIEEKFTGHMVEKLFGHEEKSIAEFSDDNELLQKAGQKAQFISGIIMPVLNFINNIVYVAIIVIGAILLTKSNSLDIGIIVTFTTYSKQLSQPITQTASIANIIQSTIASAERVFEVIDEKEEAPDIDNALTTENISGNVSFDEVDFSYVADKELIKNMNISVKSGGIVAIVGPTGAGKTTLVNLLMRFYDVSEGRISLDGKDIRNFKRSDLRKLYSMVLQDAWLFAGSIRDNIAYGKPDATLEEIKAAAEKAHIDHYILTLPDGYDTVLHEDASNLSQGQKQLLTIARAICSDYKILILDEATSSVDTRTESYIQNAMTKMMVGKTSFVIAHRLSTIKKANVILVMDNGQVIEQGTHKELLDKKGFYADLYNSQFTSPITE